jgi:hypothetical protein
MPDDFSRPTKTDDDEKDAEASRKRLERLSEILRRSRTMPESADDWQQTVNRRLSAHPQSESGILPDGSEDGG